MAKINNSLGNINSSSGSINQNNIFKFINLEKRLFEFNIDDVVSVINSIPQYTVKETDNIGYAINIYTPSGPLTYKFILTGMGKGIYGAGQPMQVAASNLELVYKDNSTQEDLLQGETQYVNLGEIGEVLPAVFINNFNGEIEFQNVDQGPVIINTFNNGIAVDYLYVGPNGIFGQGLEQTNSYYFYQFNDDGDIDIPIISTDNAPRNIYLAIEAPMTSAKALAAVNNAPTFTQEDSDVIHFIASDFTAERAAAYRFRILELGAGTYGIGGTPIVGANRVDFMGVPTTPTTEDIANLPNTQTLTWGDVNPSDFLNGQNPAIELIDPEDGAVLVITDGGSYIFQGGGGFWGVGQQQSDMSMFFPLDDVPTIEEPKPNEVFLVDFAALGISSFEEATQEMVVDWINSQPYVNAEAVIIKLVAELPPPPSNDRFFDVRADWGGYYEVTDQQTFLDIFYIECENFVLLEEGNRIQCDYISGGGADDFYDGVIFALPRIYWEELVASNTSFGVDFVFPENLFVVRLNDYPDASIPTLPTDVLYNFNVSNAPNLTSFPDLPPTVNDVVAAYCPLIDQVAIDKLATEFLQGDLPKEFWDSSDTIEPSPALKLQIIDNTTTSQF